MKKQSVHSGNSTDMGKKSKKKINRVIPADLPAAEAVEQPALPWWSRDWFWALLLILAVVLAYLPVWRAGFTWDDDTIITQNPVIVGPLGLKEIWTTAQARFYPLVLSTFWLEHALWGMAPLPFHLMNVLQHAASAVVLWRVLRSLEIRGSWLGAAIWALHPITVESVAWVSEMKNTESCLFYLLTILFFVKGLKAGDAGKPGDGRWCYFVSLLFAALAAVSKASALLLPLVLGLCAWWLKGRSSWRDLVKIVPYVVLSLVIALIVKQVAHLNGGNELHWAQSWQERVGTAGYIFWFYLGKLIWPHPLLTYYSFWKFEPDQWVSYVPTASLVVTFAILCLLAQSWGRPYFFAFAYYLLNLLPVLGLFSMTGFRYSVVEDHLQYWLGRVWSRFPIMRFPGDRGYNRPSAQAFWLSWEP
jgi:hypothetical protein